MLHHSILYTVESVTSGHPDKMCDQISDGVLDACLKQDPMSRVAIETFGSHGLLVIGGEITSTATFSAERIARLLYKQIGYNDQLNVITEIVQQSPDIAQGVNTGGAGDQGIMYGYATDETSEFLPHGIVLVHQLTRGLERLRKSETLSWLQPDGKAQVTMNGTQVKTILVSAQHDESVSQETIRDSLIKHLISELVDMTDIEILVNPTGMFVSGGFHADTGLTGRKIMVDTYGGLIPHGGGCFSGKDASKVDRSGAYMTRYVAKQLVAHGLAKRCLVSVAYAIGQAEPIMVEAINEKGDRLSTYVKQHYDFRPLAIIDRLELRKPLYSQTATYGHFGRKNLPWEDISLKPH